jgi:hypothetical protein
MKAQNEVQAMNKDLLKHTVGWVQMKSTSGVKDRTNGRDPDMLSMYGQDDLRQLVFVERERLVER